MRHVFFNFQGNAVLGVLAFLGFGFAEFIAVVTALVLFARRRRRAARRVLAGAAVAAVTRSKSLGTASSRATAHGLYRIVTLRVRFDPETTSLRRPKDMSLTPNPRFVRVVDA